LLESQRAKAFVRIAEQIEDQGVDLVLGASDREKRQRSGHNCDKPPDVRQTP
jgi:hypothetical protein